MWHSTQIGRVGAPFRWFAVVGSISALLIGFLTSRALFSDAFYNLVAGREIVQHGLSRTDPWTFLGAGRAWIDQQWLAHIAFYETDRIGGLRAVSTVSALLVGSAVGLLAMLLARRGTASFRIGIWCVVVAFVSVANALVRAQSFAYVAFVLALMLLLDDWARPSWRRRLALVLTLLAWANLHGSVVAFVPVVLLSWTVRAVRDWRTGDRRGALSGLGWSGAACIASLTTPYGFGIIGYYRSELDNTTLQHHISEWHAASITDPFETLFFVALAATIVAFVYAARRREWPSLPVVSGAAWFAYSGLVAKRSEVWFAFFAAILVCEVLTRRDARAATVAEPVQAAPPPRRRRRPALAGAVALAGAAVVLVGMLAVMGTGRALAYDNVPLKAVAVAARSGGPAARICADNDSATPLEWLYPSTRGRVAFDARFELYSVPQLKQIFRLITGPGKRLPTLFDRCDVLLVDMRGDSHRQLDRTARSLPGFRVVYDVRDQGLVAVRRSTG